MDLFTIDTSSRCPSPVGRAIVANSLLQTTRTKKVPCPAHTMRPSAREQSVLADGCIVGISGEFIEDERIRLVRTERPIDHALGRRCSNFRSVRTLRSCRPISGCIRTRGPAASATWLSPGWSFDALNEPPLHPPDAIRDLRREVLTSLTGRYAYSAAIALHSISICAYASARCGACRATSTAAATCCCSAFNAAGMWPPNESR